MAADSNAVRVEWRLYRTDEPHPMLTVSYRRASPMAITELQAAIAETSRVDDRCDGPEMVARPASSPALPCAKPHMPIRSFALELKARDRGRVVGHELQ